MPNVQIALYIVLALALIISTATDIKSRMIYDVVTGPTAIIALLVRGALVGWRGHGETATWGLLPGLVGITVGFLIFLPFGYFGGMGGGDIKLMAAVGAVVGFPVILYAIMFTSLVGGLQAVVVGLWDGSLLRTVGNAGKMLARFLRIMKPAEDDQPKKYVPYGVAIALGTVWAVIWDMTHPIWAGLEGSGQVG